MESLKRFPVKQVKTLHIKRPAAPMADPTASQHVNRMAADHFDLVSAMDLAIDARSSLLDGSQLQQPELPWMPRVSKDVVSEYTAQRNLLVGREDALAFDFKCNRNALDVERRAAQTVGKARDEDVDKFYARGGRRKGYHGQEHPLFYGDHFLSNVDVIEKTKLFGIAQDMPKGAHLHIHFNSNLKPEVLLNIAKEMDQMYITSNISLAPHFDPSKASWNLDCCKLQFSIMDPARLTSQEAEVQEAEPSKQHPQKMLVRNLFDKTYPAVENPPSGRPPMRFSIFREQFQQHYPEHPSGVDGWLLSKLVFDDEEVHNKHQTADGLVKTIPVTAWTPHANIKRRKCLGEFQYTYADDERPVQLRKGFQKIHMGVPRGVRA